MAEDMIEVRAWQSDLGLTDYEIVSVVVEIMAMTSRNIRYYD